MADLNQFLNKGLSADDVSHSNGYGAVAGGGGAGGLSMEQRRRLLNQPRVVGSYQYSRLGRQGSSYVARTADGRARVYDASSDKFSDTKAKSERQRLMTNKKQHDTQSVNRRQHTIDPTPRRFGKYA